MTSTRVDSMNKCIHAAIRRDLARLEAALATAQDGDRARAGDLQRAWAHLARQLHTHHQHEDTIFFPTLLGLGLDATLLQEMEAEHQEMERATQAIDAAMTAYAASGSTADASGARAVVLSGTEVVERHLAHEEAELEPAMRPYLDTSEWRAAEGRLRKQGPRTIGTLFAWLQDGGREDALEYFRGTLPAPVRIVFTVVFGRDYRSKVAPVWS